MTTKQKTAIKCAYADLMGALEARDGADIEAHDWKDHALTIEELREAFGFLEECKR